MTKMASQNGTWYIEQRAKHLAVMYLTRRNDLIITNQEPDYGLDFLITICKDGVKTGRIFGVQVKAAASMRRQRKNGVSIAMKFRDDNHSFYDDTPFPICLFFFTMEEDQAYYKWIKEPIFGAKTSGKLSRRESDALTKLTNEELNNIISKINYWYESKNNKASNSGATTSGIKPHDRIEEVGVIEGTLAVNPIHIGKAKKSRVKDIEIDLEERRVTKAGKPIELTPIQFKILSLLAARRNNVISRKEILEMVKGKQIHATNQTVDVSIKKLQEKLGEQNIKRVNGVGYLLA